MDKSNLFMCDKTTVGSRLVNWAHWKMASGVALGYPSMVSFMRLGGGHSAYDDVDSECIETNNAVEKLPYIPLIVIRVEYLSGYKETAVKAHACGISKRSYYNYLETAREMVANNLNLSLHIMHKHGTNMINQLEVRPA